MMRVETIHKVIVKWDELTEEKKDKIVENWDNEGMAYSHCMDERIETLKKIAEILKGNLEYSLSCVPDRGEFISIRPRDYDELDFQSLWDEIKNNEDCPFTGVYYDHDFIEKFLDKNILDENEALKLALKHYINSIHEEYNAMISKDYIANECKELEIEFDFETLERV